jgi:hypothetical protein
MQFEARPMQDKLIVRTPLIKSGAIDALDFDVRQLTFLKLGTPRCTYVTTQKNS